MAKRATSGRAFAVVAIALLIAGVMSAGALGSAVGRLDLPEWARGISGGIERGLGAIDRSFLGVPGRLIRGWFLSFSSPAGEPASTAPATAASMEEASRAPRARTRPYSAEDPLRILVVGDSMAECMEVVLNREANKRAEVALDVIFKISSCFSDPTIYDWNANIATVMDGAHYDLMIVLLGSNDAQQIWAGQNAYRYDSPEWRAVYYERVTDFLAKATTRATKVYWTSVPPMRLEGYKDRMVALNATLREICSDWPQVRHVDITPLVGNEQGLYTDALIVDGVQVVVRMTDGIHLSFAGAKIVIDEYWRLIEEDFGRPGPAVYRRGV